MPAAEVTLWRRLYYTRMRDAIRGHFDLSLDWRTMVAESGLPSDVAATIVEVVCRTRLWRSEKIAVAQELVAHFQDGRDAGQSSQQLLESFGDSMAAAKLIRRAKRRGRSYAWQIWTGAWISIVVLLVAYVFTGLCMMASRPSIKVDYLAILNEQPLSVPETERAWPIYRDALLAMGAKGVPEGSGQTSGVPDCDAKPGDANWPAMEQFLCDHSDTIAQLRAAAGRQSLGFVHSNSFAAFSPEERELFGVTVTDEQIEAYKSQTVEDRWIISTLLPELQQLRTAASLLLCDARLAAVHEDADTAMSDLVAALGVSRHCAEMPFLINSIFSKSIQQQVCVAIQDALTEHPQLYSDRQLRDLAHVLAATKIDWQHGFKGEIAGFRDTIQRLYTDDGHGDGRLAFRSSTHENVFQLLESMTGPGASDASSLYASDGLAMLVLPAANMVLASRKETTEAYEALINSALTKIGIPFWQQQGLSLPEEQILSEDAGLVDRYRYMFVRLLVPAFDNLRNGIAQLEGQRDGVFVGLALELYHREHKAWPASLAELSPHLLPEVPVDLITGKPLYYKILDDRPVVYSLGKDGDDDGGMLPKNCDGDATKFRVSRQEEWPNPNATQSTQDQYDGDWVIWSTVRSSKREAGSE